MSSKLSSKRPSKRSALLSTAASLSAAALLSACPGGEGDAFSASFDEGADTANTLDGADEAGDTDSEDTGDPPCQADADCADHPNGPVCDEALGECFPECEPGDLGECYEGPPGTLGVGACAAGSRTCSPLGDWGPCVGATEPSSEICGNAVDENCDGSLEGVDADGDGWDSCSDCCDEEGVGCVDAQLVNPGAFEVEGNEVDDDCDGVLDEPATSCDAGLSSNSGQALDYARALDLCQTTSEDPNLPPEERTWGVISAELTLADGSGSPLSVQRSIRSEFGDQNQPSGGANMVVLSTGNAAAPGQSSPNFAAFEGGENLGTSVDAPEDWVAANGGEFPATGCPGANPTTNTEANDSVMLTLRVRVPTNARSFSTRMFFFTAEYPEWVCSQYNDFFVTLVDSEADNPADKNIAIYTEGDVEVPVGLNILQTAPGLFAVCESGSVGCQGELNPWQHSCASGASALGGTGFDADDAFNSCNGNGFPVGGGTGWLEMSGNVEPGEVMDIRFAVWDAGGHLFDALVLLDDWRWSLDAAAPGVTIP